MDSPGGAQRKVFMKGAVEMVLDACDTILVEDPPTSRGAKVATLTSAVLDQRWKDEIIANMEAMTSEGLRCLALGTKVWDESQVLPSDLDENEAVQETDDGDSSVHQPPRRSVERGLTFLGLVGIYDPPRPESAPSVAQFKKASIRVHMLTGDHPGTATVRRLITCIDIQIPL